MALNISAVQASNIYPCDAGGLMLDKFTGDYVVLADSGVVLTEKLSNSMLLFVLEQRYMLLAHHVEFSVSILEAV